MKLFRVKQSVVLREEADGWGTLFEPETGNTFAINPISVFIWSSLDGTRCSEQIASEIASRCTDAPEDVVSHVDLLIDKLAERGLVEDAELGKR
jgi:SynChlorMet cassette protein ScmD